MKKYYSLIISTVLCLILVIFTGIKVNSQELYGMKTISKGIPFTWLEIYLIEKVDVFNSILSGDFTYKLDLFVLFIDILIFNILITKFLGLITKAKNHHNITS